MAPTAAPAFAKIASFALRRLGIPPAATDLASGRRPASQADGGTPVGAAVVSTDDRVPGPGRGHDRRPTTTSTLPPAGVVSATTTTTAPTRQTR